MPNPNAMSGAPRRALPIFYVLDTSGSMTGAPIERLNHAMEETIDALKEVAAHNGDAQLKIAVLEFNTAPRWVQPQGPEDMEDFFWTDLAAGGMTYMGEALKELGSKLSKDAFLSSATGSLYPVIIFMTDGFANDDYQTPLAELMADNRYFRHAVKVGFAIGEKPDSDMIARVVGDTEAVIKTDDLGLFAKLMRFVSVTSSTMASVSRTSNEELSGRTVLTSVLDMQDVDRSVIEPEFTVAPNVLLDEIQGASGTTVTGFAGSGDDLSWDSEDW